MLIQFLGATETVTGSKYLITTDNCRLLVDCGLFQGYKELRLRNWDPLPIDPSEIDYVILTHAHIDHSGYIPLLVKNGFKGSIFCTKATRDLCAILLPDSGYLQEEEAHYANRKGYSKHHPALPLYTKEEAEASLSYFRTVPFDTEIKINDQLTFSLHYAGHILGAALVRLKDNKTSIAFSGDLGRPHDPIMYPPSAPPQADYYVIESTYGDRLHEENDPELQLEKIVNKTLEKGGTVVIPAFAVGRAQAILYYLHQLIAKNKIPSTPIFIDSPMATDATMLFLQHAELHQLTKEQATEVCRTAHYVHKVDESIELDQMKEPSIIISASGMATGGRILHHIKNLAPNPNNAIVFCGFQAGGTRGDDMLQGVKQIKMFGHMVSINASIYQLTNTSAHADYSDMLNWLEKITITPKKVFITHGENQASRALKEKITERYGWKCDIPKYQYAEVLK